MAVVRMYTDGGCSNNQGISNFGGWGSILEYGEHIKELHGGEKDTTNNRMELTAVIEAFSALKRDGLDIQVFSDSSYVMDCFRQKWYLKWEQNGWVNSKKEPVENRDLWEKLLALTRKHSCQFYRVKGHVDLSSPKTDIASLYVRFVGWNGPHFDIRDFIHVTEKNNRADELANIGINEVRL